jgi:hypothetical protein
VILLEQDVLVECTVRDFSPAGAGLLLPDVAHLPAEFDVTFSHANHRMATTRSNGLEVQIDVLTNGKFKSLTPRVMRPAPKRAMRVIVNYVAGVQKFQLGEERLAALGRGAAPLLGPDDQGLSRINNLRCPDGDASCN